MTWSDVTRPPKPGVVRQFAGICCAVLVLVGVLQIFRHGRTGLGTALIAAGVVCLVLGWAVPNLFRWVFTLAMLVAFPIGFVVSQVMLAFLFFVVFLGVGLFLRVRGWDAMVRKRQPREAARGYWEPKPMPADPRRYLRQY